MKIPESNYFFKVNKDWLKLGAQEAIFLAYVSEFEANNRHCFVSRARISKDLSLSESTVQRIIRKLADEGYVILTYRGMKRTIELAERDPN